ncbi:Protein NRT1/ PTR FAMILY 6.4 [Vigna angularis]|uniref:Protein NRT1/ PTR FAMILY 6.4 n=1 Tax=Phaseolus angularis TaxID=3914 RepID=A0A8T0LES1_PHAAN|nr:Protein NRT1/ PTR FAMILY 6.4 [Vigna angularis]
MEEGCQESLSLRNLDFVDFGKKVLVASHEEEEKETEVIAAVDFRGHPVDKTKTGGWLAARLILVTYLVRDLNLPSPDSATIVTNVMGTVNLLGLVGGFLADAKLGRYLTVAISTTIAAVKSVISFHVTCVGPGSEFVNYGYHHS